MKVNSSTNLSIACIPAVQKSKYENSNRNNSDIKFNSIYSTKYYKPYIPSFGITAKETAIQKIDTFFESIRYEDIGACRPFHDSEIVNPAAYDKIKFLDRMSPFEKTVFIERYQDKTGFPDMEKVTEKILNEVKTAIQTTSAQLGIKVAIAGMDGKNSIVKKKAIPGSDCDYLFIIIDSDDEAKVAQFHETMSKHVDRFIMSYPKYHPPFIFTLNKFKKMLDITNEAFNKYLSDLPPEKARSNIKKFRKNINTAYERDYISAAEFNLKLHEYIPDVVNKSELFNISVICELIHNGTIFFNNLDNNDKKFIKSSALYQYSNIKQQKGSKHVGKIKFKFRDKYLKEFKNWTVDDQFELIKQVIYSGFGMRPPKDSKYAKLFHNFGDGTPTSELGNSPELKKQLLS